VRLLQDCCFSFLFFLQVFLLNVSVGRFSFSHRCRFLLIDFVFL